MTKYPFDCADRFLPIKRRVVMRRFASSVIGDSTVSLNTSGDINAACQRPNCTTFIRSRSHLRRGSYFAVSSSIRRRRFLLFTWFRQICESLISLDKGDLYFHWTSVIKPPIPDHDPRILHFFQIADPRDGAAQAMISTFGIENTNECRANQPNKQSVNMKKPLLPNRFGCLLPANSWKLIVWKSSS